MKRFCESLVLLPAGGYFTIRNTGPAVAITGVQSEACGSLMMHQSSNAGGVSRMAMVDKVTLSPGQELRFAPSGYHLMCENPKMKIGTRVPVSLTLSDGSHVVVGFDVRGATGK